MHGMKGLLTVLAALSSSAAAQEAAMPHPIFAAVAAGDAGRIETMLAAEPEAALARDEAGRTPLMMAAYMEKSDLVSLIAGRHPGPDFFESCIMGDEAPVRAALTAGRDPDSLSPDGFTCLGLAVFFRQPAVARLLIESGADVSLQASNSANVGPVHAAVARQDVDTLALLLAQGADANAPQQRGMRPLHDAAAGGNAAIVALLLMYGADPAAITDDGRMVAAMALSAGHAELAARLEDLAGR